VGRTSTKASKARADLKRDLTKAILKFAADMLKDTVSALTARVSR
jgi:hypothetical protein